MLEAPFSLSLTTAELQLATSNLVGWRDLVQRGNAHEPFHSALDGPRQLMEWDHITGTFSPRRQVFEPAEKRPIASVTRSQPPPVQADSFSQRVDALAARITSIVGQIAKASKTTATGDASTGDAATGEAATGEVATGEAATGEAATGDAMSSVVVVVDLDQTIWKGDCIDWPPGSFQPYPTTAPAAPCADLVRTVYDPTTNRFLELHEDVPLIFAALRTARVPLAIASASPATESAHALLRAFGLMGTGKEADLVVQMGTDDDLRGSHKVIHLQRLAERMGIEQIQHLVRGTGTACTYCMHARAARTASSPSLNSQGLAP